VGHFELQNVESGSIEVIKEVLDYCFKEAIKYSTSMGTKPEKIFAAVRSENLERDIGGLVIHQINEDAVQSLANRFDEISTSNENNGRSSLYGAPFTVDLTMIGSKTSLSSSHQGSGRRFGPFFQNYSRNSVIWINNDDKYCLFRALEMLRKKTTSTKETFYQYKITPVRQYNDVQRLMKCLRIPLNKESYSINDYGEKIQQYYDRRYGQNGKRTFKIFAFCDWGKFKPFFESTAQTFTHPICLYYNNNHYDAIGCIASFFSVRKYCFACQRPFNRDATHDTHCHYRCRICCTVDPSRCPCLPEQFYIPRKCKNCRKVFESEWCWDRHLENGACNLSKFCKKCGVIYVVRPETEETNDEEENEEPEIDEAFCGQWDTNEDGELEWNPNIPPPKKQKKKRTHRCKFTYCKTCKTYHDYSRGCFIKKVELPKKKEDYRIIIMDCETTQCFKPVPDQLKYLHEVNFISARVVCTRCIEEDRWEQSIDEETPCEICGDRRNVTWSQREFRGTEVDKNFVSDNPLRQFVLWLLHNFNKGETKAFYSLVLAHNG
jgi:hypothetical protein